MLDKPEAYGAVRGSAGVPRIVSALSLLAFAAFALIVLVSSLTRPIANWDMLAYAGSVVRHQGETDPARVQERAFGLVRQAVTPDQWANLTQASHYSQVQATDPRAFASMLPMYEVKGGYNRVISWLAGRDDVVRAMRLVSLVSVLGMLALLAWSFARLGALHWLAFTLPVLASLRVVDMASMGSPDAAVALLSVAAGVAMLSGGRAGFAVAAAVLALAVWFRPDMLVASAGLPFAIAAGFGLAAWLGGEDMRAALKRGLRAGGVAPFVGAAAGVGAYVLAKQGVQHPGWWTHFNFTFVAPLDDLTGFSPPFDVAVYVKAVIRAVTRMLRDETWPWLTLAFMVGVLLHAGSPRSVPRC